MYSRLCSKSCTTSHALKLVFDSFAIAWEFSVGRIFVKLLHVDAKPARADQCEISGGYAEKCDPHKVSSPPLPKTDCDAGYARAPPL